MVETFQATDIEGEIIVCRECLIEGDLTANDLEDFWSVRQNYLSKAYPKNENFYTENIRAEFEKLLNVSNDDEVNFWFEYELFCQVNFWFCLWLIWDKDTNFYRVAPVVRNEDDKWKGFGGLSATKLKKCFDQRTKLSKDDVQFGKQLWKAFVFRSWDYIDLEKQESFPYLKEVCEAASEIGTRPKQRVREILEEGETEFGKVFQKFNETEGIYGFGDLQVKRIYDDLLT